MKLDNLPGNEQVKEKLKKLLKQKEMPSPLLFTGPAGIGKEAFARAFAEALLAKKQAEPKVALNVRPFAPEGKGGLYLAEQLKEMVHAISMRPFDGDHQVILLKKAERITTLGANTLLKTLEEPPSYTTIVLTSSAPTQLLPTLLSRCFELSFCPLSEAELCGYLTRECSLSETNARRLALLAHGNLTRAEELAKEDKRPFFSLIAAVATALIERDLDALAPLLRDLDALVAKKPTEQRAEQKEEICLALFYWYRDLELLTAKGSETHLFFAEDLDALKGCLSLPRPSLDEIGKRMEKIDQALKLNLKLSHVLDSLL